MKKQWDSILFDLDGTLWDAVKNITDIWNEGVKEHPDVTTVLTENDVRSIMGLNTKEIGAALFPDLSEEKQWEVMMSCSAAEARLLPETGGILYPDLVEVLTELSAKVPLFIVSNCDEGYIEAFLHYHKVSAYFTDHLCYGDTLLDKPHNIAAIVKKHGLKSPLYVGDTEKDRVSAAAANTDFVYAAYGFGTVTEKTLTVNSLKELAALFR